MGSKKLSKSSALLSLILWIAVFQLIAYGMGLLTQINIQTWYQALEKSSINPPQIVFPIVWCLLYVILAIAGWLLWQNKDSLKGKVIFLLYTLQMLMNWAWTPIFFQFRLIELGFYWILAMILLTIIVICMAKKQAKTVYYLLIPYCLWLIFAGYLNWAIWMKN